MRLQPSTDSWWLQRRLRGAAIGAHSMPAVSCTLTDPCPCVRAPQNKQQRYRCYRAGARALGYTYRRPLPNCFVWAVRMLYPEPGGVYVGYRPP
eukprot:COSAG01_NODE_55_length_31115_cov_105.202533_7_plen_94_part_00